MTFWTISLETANEFYTWGWRASMFGALVTFFGVAFLFWGTRVRDHDFESQIANLHTTAADSEERSRLLGKETESLRQTNLQLAADVEREKAARLRIEDGLASRHVQPEQRRMLIDSLKGVTANVLISTYSDPETSTYEAEITRALNDAGITVTRGSVILSSSQSPLTGLLIEQDADARLIKGLSTAGLLTQMLLSTKNPMLHTGEGLNAIVVGV